MLDAYIECKLRSTGYTTQIDSSDESCNEDIRGCKDDYEKIVQEILVNEENHLGASTSHTIYETNVKNAVASENGQAVNSNLILQTAQYHTEVENHVPTVSNSNGFVEKNNVTISTVHETNPNLNAVPNAFQKNYVPAVTSNFNIENNFSHDNTVYAVQYTSVPTSSTTHVTNEKNCAISNTTVSSQHYMPCSSSSYVVNEKNCIDNPTTTTNLSANQEINQRNVNDDNNRDVFILEDFLNMNFLKANGTSDNFEKFIDILLKEIIILKTDMKVLNENVCKVMAQNTVILEHCRAGKILRDHILTHLIV